MSGPPVDQQGAAGCVTPPALHTSTPGLTAGRLGTGRWHRRLPAPSGQCLFQHMQPGELLTIWLPCKHPPHRLFSLAEFRSIS